MKRLLKLTLTFVLLATLLSSCLVVSLHPLGSPTERIWDPALLGVWTDPEGGGQFVFTRHPNQETATYRMYSLVRNQEKYGDDVMIPGSISDRELAKIEEGLRRQSGRVYLDNMPDTVRFAANVYKVGDHYFLDMAGDADYRLFENFLPVHTFARISWAKAEMRMQRLDDEKLSDLFEEKRIRLAHQITSEGIAVLTASGPQIREFLKKYTRDESVFESTISLQRQ